MLDGSRTEQRAIFRVLLVEDNPGDARLVRIMLSETGPSASFDVTHVETLGEAVGNLEEAEFDVVLLDLSLPDASGLEAVNRMQSAASHLPVVVLSGLSDEEVALQAIQGGVEDYLVKGYGDGDLIARSIRYAIERKRAEEHLAYLSQYDSLTGLANRALFQDRLAQTCARADRNGNPVALMFLDLDRFKSFNDALGHSFGDMLLRTVAERLTECVREGDTVARMGSDEFGVILEGIRDAGGVASMAQRIADALSLPFLLHDREVFVTISMGIVVREPHGNVDMIKDATAAMHRAKEFGSNNYQFFTPEMNVQAFQRLAFEGSLRRALERDEFLLHYQPQVDLRTGRIVGAEALLRWRHPDLGVISPEEFVPILEETGIVIPVGEWVLRTACEQARAWQEADDLPPLRVAVNLSARQFKQHDLTETVSGALRLSGLDPERLELEITESVLMENAQTSGVRLAKLKMDEGLRVSIDDFGTGYSSLSYLKRFPLDVLKIDQSFVRDIADDPDDAAIVSAIIALAHNLRLEVIAEGVETEAQLAFLRERGCDQIQGFHFSRPLPPDAFARLVRKAKVSPQA